MKLSHKEVNTYYDEAIFRKEGYFIRRFMSKSEQLPVYFFSYNNQTQCSSSEIFKKDS